MFWHLHKRLLHSVTIISVCCLEAISTADICRTPFGALADVLPLKECTPMVDFIMKYGPNLTSDQRTFLERSFVNYEKRLICCNRDFDAERAFSSIGREILRNQADFCGDSTRKRISFGSESTFLAHPWAVLLMYEDKLKFQCGGTLITNRYVLTAAHCIKSNLIAVRLGEHNIQTERDCELDELGEQHCLTPALDVGVENAIKHPLYTTNFDNDIGLVRLAMNIKFIDSMKPICIPELQNEVFENEWGIIAGWGATEKSSFSNVHRQANIPFISRENCQTVHRRRHIDDTKLCTRGIEGEDTCQGDSGGPLYVRVEGRGGRKFRYMQVGIISLGFQRCGTKVNVPGLYTHVAAFIDWIGQNIQL